MAGGQACGGMATGGGDAPSCFEGGGGRTRRSCPTGSILPPPQWPIHRGSVRDGRRMGRGRNAAPTKVPAGPSTSLRVNSGVPALQWQGQAPAQQNGRQAGCVDVGLGEVYTR